MNKICPLSLRISVQQLYWFCFTLMKIEHTYACSKLSSPPVLGVHRCLIASWKKLLTLY